VQRTADLGEEIHLEALGRAVEGMAAITEAASNQRPIPLIFALCADHRRTEELAEQLVPDAGQRVARAAVGCALDALSFTAPGTVEQMAFLDPEGLAALVRHLAQPGAQARWVSRFVPIIAPEADPNTCAPYPFGHLMIGQRQTLRKAYAALLRERVARNAPPVKVPPPRVIDRAYTASALVVVEGGCMICGVGHQKVDAAVAAREGLANVARDLWTPKRTGSQQLGGRPSANQLSGHLCRVCADAVEHVHAMGPSAMERALLTALAPEKVGLLPYGQFSVNGLVGWGALVAHARQTELPEPDPKPNERPWEHLGDLPALSERLSAAMG
jgi:hypothetical protein